MKTGTTRFSKKELAISLWDTINELEKEYNFKTSDGWNQVDGKGEEINRKYGEYVYAIELINCFNLEYPTN